MFNLKYYLRRARTIGFLDSLKKIAGYEEILPALFESVEKRSFTIFPTPVLIGMRTRS